MKDITILANGPLIVEGPLEHKGEILEGKIALCRCGASANKPFCDGRHKTVGFIALETLLKSVE